MGACLTALAAACGDDDGTPRAVERDGPAGCGALDSGTIGNALGSEIVDQSQSFHASAFEGVAFGSEGCTFATAEGVEVAVMLVADELGRSAPIVEQLRGAASAAADQASAGPASTDLSDIAEEAFYDDLSRSIVARENGVTFTVSLGDPFVREVMVDADALVALAREVAAVIDDERRDRALCAAMEPIAVDVLGSIRGRGEGEIAGTRGGEQYAIYECSFEGDDGRRLDVGRGGAEVFDVLDMRDSTRGERPFEPVDGVGDVAFWWRSGLWVVEDDTGLLIEGSAGDVTASDAQVLEVARLAVDAFAS
jgi:hypothetical protein